MATRCFFAIALPKELVARLRSSADALLHADPSWAGEKWVDPGNLHVTIAFMPSVPGSAVGGLLDEMAVALSDTPGLTLTVRGIDAVPHGPRARLVWASLDSPDGAVGHLASIVRDVSYLFLADDSAQRSFKPHVTLCRARRPRALDPDALAAAESILLEGGPPVMSVSEVTLFSSVLDRSGPTYSRIGSVLLKRD